MYARKACYKMWVWAVDGIEKKVKSSAGLTFLPGIPFLSLCLVAPWVFFQGTLVPLLPAKLPLNPDEMNSSHSLCYVYTLYPFIPCIVVMTCLCLSAATSPAGYAVVLKKSISFSLIKDLPLKFLDIPTTSWKSANYFKNSDCQFLYL